MTPINLEDVESYLNKQASHRWINPDDRPLRLWLRDRFAELRAREAAVLKTG